MRCFGESLWQINFAGVEPAFEMLEHFDVFSGQLNHTCCGFCEASERRLSEVQRFGLRAGANYDLDDAAGFVAVIS